MAVGLRQPHRQIDGGMVGHVEEQDLRGADQQDVFDLRRRRRQALFKQRREQMPQGAEPAQHRRDDGPHQRAVALGQRAEIAARSSCSSSGRCWRSTPPTMSAAMRRAARPGDGGDEERMVCGRAWDACHAPLSLHLTTPMRQAQGLDLARGAQHLTGMTSSDDPTGKTARRKTLSPAAERALAEAAAAPRRIGANAKPRSRAKEVGGPSGPEPTRYGDWEKKGLTSDF